MLFFIEPDRLIHTLCSFFGSGIIFMICLYGCKMNFYKSIILAIYSINILGFGYETYQVLNGTYSSMSLKDLFYNGFGSALLVFFLLITHYRYLLLPDPMLYEK